MQFDWPRVRVGDLIAQGKAILQTGPFGSQLHQHDYVVEGVPVIPTEAIGRGHIRPDAILPRISETKASELVRHRLFRGDILFARRGIQATGLSALVGTEHEGALCGTGAILLRVDHRQVSPEFLSSVLSSDESYEWLRAHAVGAVMPNLNSSIISQLEIPLPSLDVQRRIAETVHVFWDRIQTLRECGQIIERIAQSVFKSWFVDFEPVHARAEGRQPEGMDPSTAALFPSSFEESEIGLIPKGWEVGLLSDHVSADRGLSYKGSGLCGPGEGLPMHNLNSVLESGGYKYAGLKHYSGDFKDRHVALSGDVLVANTEQGHDHRLIGFPAIVPERFERAIYSHHLYRLRIKPGSPLTRHVLYYMLMAPSVREQVIGCANGSTVNMLKPAGVQIPRFACPSAAVSMAFEDLAGAIRRQIEANAARIDVLAALRETLLPRLITGKLRLPECQSELEGATA